MSTAPKMKSSVAEVLTEDVRKRASEARTTSTAAEAREFQNIEANSFYKVMFSKELSPEQKREEVAKALVFAGSREEMKTRLQEFESFKEYLQTVREEMAKEIIGLTDTEAFSELKLVYDELNNGVLAFEEKMKPLTDIIDALYVLRTKGQTMEAFEEIKKAREEEARIKSERQTVEQEVSALEERIRTTQYHIAELGEDKSFFGLGGLKKTAREKIARKELEVREAQDRLGELTEQVKQLDERKAKIVDVGEFADEKQKLRELLDISTDEHRDRQKALVDTALGFVNTAKSRIGQVRGHLGKMNGQVDNLFTANNHMATAYAILNEGIKVAEKENQDVRAKLVPPSDQTEEDMITKMKREQQKMDVEEHIARLDSAAADTMATYADLTSQTIRIKDMRDANTAQIDRARSMHTQGIAAVADRLSTVLQAVSSAALGESSAMAKDTLVRVNDHTNKIAMKESIRVAMGLDETNQELAKAIEDLGAYGEVVREGTKIQHQSIAEMREKLDELQKVAQAVSADIQDSVATHANVALGVKSSGPGERSTAKPSIANPFRSA